MKKTIIQFKKWHFTKMLIGLSFMAFLFSQCEIQKNYEYEYSQSTGGKLGVTAWQYIQATDSLSLMAQAITAAGMQDYYSGSTEYTFIVPRNSAFRSYMKTNKYSGISAIPVATLQSILGYHIVKDKVLFSDPALSLANNPIEYQTVSGQVMYLSHNTNYQGLINQGTKKSWTIITSNLQPTNGVIHVTDAIVYLSL